MRRWYVGDGTGGDWGEGAAFEGVHEVEVGPGVGPRALGLGAVALAELLDLVTALEGGLGGGLGVVVAAAGGYGDRHLLPLRRLELAAPHGGQLLLVRLDQMHRLLVRPWQGLRLLEGAIGGSGGGGRRGAGHFVYLGLGFRRRGGGGGGGVLGLGFGGVVLGRFCWVRVLVWGWWWWWWSWWWWVGSNF